MPDAPTHFSGRLAALAAAAVPSLVTLYPGARVPLRLLRAGAPLHPRATVALRPAA